MSQIFPAVQIRAVEPEDVDFMMECENEADSFKWSDTLGPVSRNQLLTYALTYDADPFSAGQLRLIIENSLNQRIGIIDLYEISEKDSRAFIGICIKKSFRRKEYAAAALEAVKQYNIEKLGLAQLAAKVSVENTAAIGLFEKVGFNYIASLPRWHKVGTKFHDFCLYVFFFNFASK